MTENRQGCPWEAEGASQLIWINSATMLQRANFAAEFTSGKRFGRMTPVVDDFVSPVEAVEYFSELLLATDLGQTARNELVFHYRRTTGSAPKRIAALVHLLMTLPEYQLT